MAAGTRLVAPAIIATFDFSRFGVVADIGGGTGTLLAAILVANPGVRGLLFDSEAGLEATPDCLGKAGVTDRCDVVAGDFFQSVPAGAHLYILKHIIHDWNDEQSVTILRNCRAAMKDDARLLLLEGVMPDPLDASERTGALVMSDINMLLKTGGRERTLAEFESLLASAGFRLVHEAGVEAPYPLSVIEGCRSKVPLPLTVVKGGVHQHPLRR